MRGGVHVPTYRSWQMMKNRCLNPNAADFTYYGGRGISIDPTWMSFDQFFLDMGERPSDMTLDRICSDLMYTKTNCRWASRLVQARNRAFTIDLEYGGRTQKVWEWAEELGIKPSSLHLRLWRFKRGEFPYARVFRSNPRAK